MEFLQRVQGGTQGRIEVRCRLGQETSLAPPCSKLRSFGSKCAALTKKLTPLLGFFGAPQWSGVRVIVDPSFYPYFDTSRQSAQLWNLKSPECRTTCPNWEITARLGRPCILNSQRKNGETSPAGLTHGKAAQWSSKAKVEWLHLRPCLVLPWCRDSRATWSCCWL